MCAAGEHFSGRRRCADHVVQRLVQRFGEKHYLDFAKGKITEHEVIQYCKANPGKLIIEAIAIVFKDERARLGIQMKAD